MRYMLHRLRLLIRFVIARFRYKKRFYRSVPIAVYKERLFTCMGCPLLNQKNFECTLCECDVRLKCEWDEEGCPDTPPRWQPHSL